jgi:hypothetical protein
MLKNVVGEDDIDTCLLEGRTQRHLSECVRQSDVRREGSSTVGASLSFADAASALSCVMININSVE